MSTREKNLLIVLGIALFAILNFVAYTMFYAPAITKAKNAQFKAETDLKQKQLVLARRDELEPDLKWLESTGEVATTPQLAQSQLQSLIRKQADARTLDTRDEQILSYIPGTHFSRVRVLFKVTGMESNVQQWLLSIHQPKQRQVITRLEMKPQGNDLTRIECTVEVEKWIITNPADDLV